MIEYRLELLERARLVRGLSYAEIGRGIGVDPRTVRRVENGETANPNTVWEIARYLGVSMEDLIKVRRKRG